MKSYLFRLLFIVLGLTLGGAYAIFNIKKVSVEAEFMLSNGPWRVNPSMDLQEPKQRALIALVGLFALRESEVLYYNATVDSHGAPLSSEHDYILTGLVPEARYWSYTIYGEDDFLIPNESKLYGYNAETINYIPKDSLNPEINENWRDSYQIKISSTKQDGNWLPSGDNEALSITLRLYNAAPSVYENLSGVALPEIIKVSE